MKASIFLGLLGEDKELRFKGDVMFNLARMWTETRSYYPSGSSCRLVLARVRNSHACLNVSDVAREIVNNSLSDLEVVVRDEVDYPVTGLSIKKHHVILE